MSPRRSLVYVSKPSDIPSKDHWAIIEGSSYWTPGDERSRTNPGHGYPESTTPIVNYIAFTDEAEFKERVKELLLQGKQFRAIQVKSLAFDLDVSLRGAK